MNKTNLRAIFFLVSLFLINGASTAQAGFDFAPIIATLTPSGQSATASFVVTNMETTKLAVQITIVPREPDVNGKEEYKESEKTDEMFRIFPNQIVLEPKAVRTVRVSYIGTPTIGSELAFRIIAEELPVDLDDPKKVYTKAMAKITLATRYIGSLYVSPKSAKAEIVAEAKPSKEDPTKMVLSINNKGSLHQVYKKPSLKVLSTTNGKEFIFPDAQLVPLTSQNVLAGRTRVYNLPWPKELPTDGPVKVTLDAGPE